MGEPTYASLSSGLLARKGAAKPAMRPQGYGHFGGNLEDLGWNDMGAGEPPVSEHQPSPITALSPAPRHRDEAEERAEACFAPPPVVEQQRAIAQSFAEEVAPLPAVAAEMPAVRPAAKRQRKGKTAQAAAEPRSSGGRKAAFTLRLDTDRHYKLRLASAVTGRSSQQIVTAALDEWLTGLPQIDGLAAQLPPGGTTRSC